MLVSANHASRNPGLVFVVKIVPILAAMTRDGVMGRFYAYFLIFRKVSLHEVWTGNHFENRNDANSCFRS